VAIVTGSSRSIGAAIAITLSEHGATVVVNYVHGEKAAEAVVETIRSNGKDGKALAVKADVSTIEGGKHLLEETIKAYGRVDILVLNAGIMGSKPL